VRSETSNFNAMRCCLDCNKTTCTPPDPPPQLTPHSPPFWYWSLALQPLLYPLVQILLSAKALPPCECLNKFFACHDVTLCHCKTKTGWCRLCFTWTLPIIFARQSSQMLPKPTEKICRQQTWEHFSMEREV